MLSKKAKEVLRGKPCSNQLQIRIQLQKYVVSCQEYVMQAAGDPNVNKFLRDLPCVWITRTEDLTWQPVCLSLCPLPSCPFDCKVCNTGREMAYCEQI